MKWSLCLSLVLAATHCDCRALNTFSEEEVCHSYHFDGRSYVDCSDLGLTTLPNELNYRAQVLKFRNNRFVTFPTDLELFVAVEELDLSGNFISQHLPSYMKIFNNLHTLNLSNNNYEVWRNDGVGSKIITLDLSKNKIGSIEETAFSEMKHLYTLNLSENRLYDLPKGLFAETRYLDNLILARNYFSTVPGFETSSLRSLDLSSCQIASLNVDSLARMSSLLEINLSMNQIETVPDNFSSSTLQELDLSYNNVNVLTDYTFSSLRHLAVVNLRGNDLKEIWPTSVFASNNFVRKIHLKGNRWSCEGFGVNLLLTYEYLTKAPSKVNEKSSLICYTPNNVTQLSWQEAYIKTWHPNEGRSSFSLAAVFSGMIIGVLLTSALCRGLMVMNKTRNPPPHSSSSSVETPLQQTSDSVILRVPLREDLPPSYDEALLMPRLNASFHSLPDFVDEDEEDRRRRFRRSRSIGDLIEPRRTNDRRSVRPHNSNEVDNT